LELGWWQATERAAIGSGSASGSLDEVAGSLETHHDVVALIGAGGDVVGIQLWEGRGRIR